SWVAASSQPPRRRRSRVWSEGGRGGSAAGTSSGGSITSTSLRREPKTGASPPRKLLLQCSCARGTAQAPRASWPPIPSAHLVESRGTKLASWAASREGRAAQDKEVGVARRWQIRHKLMLGLATAIGILALLVAGTLNGL